MKSFKQYYNDSQLCEEALLLERLSSDMEEIKQLLKKKLKLKEKDFKELSANRLAILSDGNRGDLLDNIANLLAPIGWKYNRSTKVSSIGHVEKGKMFVLVKPRSRQGMKSAGLANETTIIATLREAIELNGGPLTVTFVSGRKKSSHQNIVKVVDAGRDTSGRKKADIVLVNEKGKEFPISIKEDGAENWESADNYWGKHANKFITELLKNGEISMDLQNAGYYRLKPQFAVKANEKETKDVVFGSDILSNHGAVVERTFRSKDFLYRGDRNEILIKCTNIITKMKDVKGRDTVWFLVRNDSTRNNKLIGYPGIRVLAVFQSRIGKTVLKVDRNYV